MSYLRKIQKTIARCLIRQLADRHPMESSLSDRMHIVVPRWDAKLGDSIVSSFFFREARKLNARVTVLTVSELAPLHTEVFGVDRVIVTGASPGVARLRHIARQLGPVDVVVHLVGRIQPAEIMFLHWLQPSRVYSLDDDLRCVNRKFGAATADKSFPERYEQVLLDLGAKAVERQYIVPLPPLFQGAADAPQILVNSYASRPDKGLSFNTAVMLLRAVADAYPGKSVGILCSPVTRADAQRLETSVGRPNVRALKDLNTPTDAAGYIIHAHAVVSVDTAIVHMAVGLETRLVAIYPAMGDEHNPWLPPLSTKTTVVYSPQDEQHYRRTGQKNMNAFSIEDVVTELDRLLSTDTGIDPVITLHARIVAGLGVATGTLARQLPLISQAFPEVGECYPGTINLLLERPLVVTRPDHRTAPIAWTPSGRITEVFDLVRIELELDHSPLRVPAWLYIAHGSLHRQTPSTHEVIAQALDLEGIQGCRIHLRANAVALA
ncbi:glycosyltransferase family 9 protein [Pseudomonas tolaasii]|uniref:glycosyltransferase family 9 protein n=1 Tax=Pseudomonas tolaasii TaxID=29442 RepID=UPI0015A11C31|nr:glycosyltransferase family 9 protein [Pseudomonas tolaasii]NVZ45405.1 glycosyltransferase family 9 protein [Pseudomonas tolaasii]NWA48615.1 glycosyltransferase family 9 protein [Pseudomonas tolaasii]